MQGTRILPSTMPPPAPARSRLPPDFASSAAYALFAFDPRRDRGWVLHLAADDYRRAGFLDRRALRGDMPGWEVTRGELTAAIGSTPAPLPLHWLFHIGHCGSTLVSRLLDLLPGVLGLREPLPLLALAHTAAHPAGEAWFGPTVRLLARGFDDTTAVVVKPTSVVTGLAARLLAPAPEGGGLSGRGRACLLWTDLRSWLATMLRAPGLVDATLAQAPLRTGGIGLPDAPAGPATGLARVWLAEQLRWRRLAGDPACADRAMDLDFAAVLSDPAGAIAGLARHYGLPVPDDWGERVAGSGLLDRYAKDPGQPFDARKRERELEASLQRHGTDIGAALEWAAGALPADARDLLLPRLRPSPAP